MAWNAAIHNRTPGSMNSTSEHFLNMVLLQAAVQDYIFAEAKLTLCFLSKNSFL